MIKRLFLTDKMRNDRSFSESDAMRLKLYLLPERQSINRGC
jgi:hypothetical protein